MASSLGARTWWAYHCLPRNAAGKLPPTTALETSVDPPLARGLIGKLHVGKQHTVEPDVGERLASVLGTTYDWLVRGIGAWPKPSGEVPVRVVSYKGQVKLATPIRETVKPVEHGPLLLMDTSVFLALNESTRELAAAKVKIRHADWPQAEIAEAVNSVAAMRHAETVDVDVLGKMAEFLLLIKRGQVADETLEGLFQAATKKPKRKS